MQTVERRRILKGALLGSGCVVGALLLVVSGWLGYHRYALRSCAPGLRWPGTRTRCAPAYSEGAFALIHRGMDRAEVERRLGPPLKILEMRDGRILRMMDLHKGSWRVRFPDLPMGSGLAAKGYVLFYTQQQDAHANWFVRSIDVDASGRVERVFSDFYVD